MRFALIQLGGYSTAWPAKGGPCEVLPICQPGPPVVHWKWSGPGLALIGNQSLLEGIQVLDANAIAIEDTLEVVRFIVFTVVRILKGATRSPAQVFPVGESWPHLTQPILQLSQGHLLSLLFLLLAIRPMT
eukprot:1427385-Amphidinium_carterae.1